MVIPSKSLLTPASSMDSLKVYATTQDDEGGPPSLASTASWPGMEFSIDNAGPEGSNNESDQETDVDPLFSDDETELEDGSNGQETDLVPLFAVTPGTPRPGEELEDVDWKGLDPSSIDPTSFEPQNSDVRILMLPMVEGVSISSYGGKAGHYDWVQVNMMDRYSVPAKLLAIAPSSDHVGCKVTYGNDCYILYFDPGNDRLIFRNRSCNQVVVAQLYGEIKTEVGGKGSTTLKPSEWGIFSSTDRCLVQFKSLRRKTWQVTPGFHTKRSGETAADSLKKARLSGNRSAGRAGALEGASSSNPLLTLERGEVINVEAGSDSYQLTREAPIADTRFSSVWAGKHSKMPGKTIVTKVIKAGSSQKDASIQAAEVWLREMSIHSSLKHHYAIVPYLGRDARFQSIYTEYVDAKALPHHVRSDRKTFNGNTVRVWRILGDIGSALAFLHGNGIVHGDIKLGNILFNPVRGAVLIDFNLSFREGHPINVAGSPWYLPPEYLQDSGLHGVASDMWALGVVMLWTLGHLPMPELQQGWDIAALHPDGSMRENNDISQIAMMEWLNVVRRARLDLEAKGGELSTVVSSLLREEQDHRSDAETLVQKLARCNMRQPSDVQR